MYSVVYGFPGLPALARSVKFMNQGNETVTLERVLSASIDLADSDYKMLSLTGAWARERSVRIRKLEHGLQGTGSRKGCSSSEFNPFLALARPGYDGAAGNSHGIQSGLQRESPGTG